MRWDEMRCGEMRRGEAGQEGRGAVRLYRFTCEGVCERRKCEEYACEGVRVELRVYMQGRV